MKLKTIKQFIQSPEQIEAEATSQLRVIEEKVATAKRDQAQNTADAQREAGAAPIPGLSRGAHPSDEAGALITARAELELAETKADTVAAYAPENALRAQLGGFLAEAKKRRETTRQPVAEVIAPPAVPPLADLADLSPGAVTAAVTHQVSKLEAFDVSMTRYETASTPIVEHDPLPNQLRAVGEAYKLLKATRVAAGLPWAEMLIAQSSSELSELDSTKGGGWILDMGRGRPLEGVAQLAAGGDLTAEHLALIIGLLGPQPFISEKRAAGWKIFHIEERQKHLEQVVRSRKRQHEAYYG